MKREIRDRQFFVQPAQNLAPALLGKIFCRRMLTGEIFRFRLTETEAYCYDDSACHANKYKGGNGVITQNMIGGTIYIHYDNKSYDGSSFDVVANDTGVGEGVLIRGGINIDNPIQKYDSKPRLLGEALKMDYHELNQEDLVTSKKIWIEDDGFAAEGKISCHKRIGLEESTDITEFDKNRMLRFTLNMIE